MMNPTIKARWTAWLRANADKQSVGKLSRTFSAVEDRLVGFCCLGGLCELAVQDGVIVSMVLGGDMVRYVNYGANADWSGDVLPEAVAAWAGLESCDPEVRVTVPPDGQTGLHSLTALNDDYRFNFNQIADLIDEQL